jgi:dTDP-glucose pyrophosphorylase
MDLALVVLAAGIGSRYGGLKQIDPVGPSGEIIIDYSIYDALRAGVNKVVFVIRPEIEAAFRAKIGRRVEARCETAYAYQSLEDLPLGFAVPEGRLKPWGTAHATLCARAVVDTPFLVINADDFYGRTSFEALAGYLGQVSSGGSQHDYALVGYRLGDTLTKHGHVARGECIVGKDGYLVEVHERSWIERCGAGARYTDDGQHWVDIPLDTPVSMNSWGFTLSFFEEMLERFPIFLRDNQANILKAEYFLPEVVCNLIEEERARVKVLPSQERWFGVTYPQDKARVQQAIRALVSEEVYPANLWA